MSADLELKIEEHPSFQALVISKKLKMMQIAKAMGESYAEINQHMQKSGYQMTLPPFGHYLGFSWEKSVNMGFLSGLWMMFTYEWNIEIGIPTTGNLTGAGNVKVIDYKPMKVVSAIHTGAYQKVADTYKPLYQFAVDNKLSLKPESFEFYYNDPKVTKQSDLKTKILAPVQ